MFYANTNQKKAYVAVLISDRANLREIIRDKKNNNNNNKGVNVPRIHNA